MDGTLDDWINQRETVDVETRAIVSSLVTAVSSVAHARWILLIENLAWWYQHRAPWTIRAR